MILELDGQLLEAVGKPAGREQLTVGAAAVGLASVPPHANYAVLQVQTANVRMTQYSDTPTATVGFSLSAGAFVRAWGNENIRALLFVRETATSGLVVAEYYEVRLVDAGDVTG